MEPVIIQQTDNFIVINKPIGWLSIPGRDKNANIPVLSHWLGKKLNQKIFVVHRLDQGTSGVIIFALNKNTHRQFSMMFENSEVKKTYVALVEGVPENQLIDAPLFKLPGKKNKSVVSKEKGKPSQTIIKVLKSNQNISLIEATPLTGRTHQIRVHLSHIGHSLLGDTVYGGKNKIDNINLPTPLLHAKSLELEGHHFECTPSGLFQDLVFKYFEAK